MFRLPALLILALPTLAVLLGATLPQAEAQEKTPAILSPTAAQIGRGAVLYRLACAMCHGDELEGDSAEALAGADFRATDRALSPRAIHHLIDGLHGHLPPVSKQEALDVTAFILDFNGLPLEGELVEAGLDRVDKP